MDIFSARRPRIDNGRDALFDTDLVWIIIIERHFLETMDMVIDPTSWQELSFC